MLTDNPIMFILVLVAAIGIGWLLRGRIKHGTAPVPHPGLTDDYFRGLNHLLNEEQDKALEIFIRMVEVDSDTVETHFALGSLFRRRGEVDRAIRIHQNLIARPSLSRHHRQQALYELGEDYMRAGLFDRAESLFADLAQSGPFVGPALAHLMAIYEQQSDWEQAVGAARRMELVEGRSQQRVISHYHCEMAEIALQTDQHKRAIALVKKAQSADPGNIRADILNGQIAEARGEPRDAIRAYSRAIDRAPTFAGEIIEALQDCFRKDGDLAGFDRWLEDIATKRPDSVAAIAVAALSSQQLQGDALKSFVERYMASRGQSLSRLLEMVLPTQGPGTGMDPARELFRLLSESYARYLCTSCGLAANTLYWQCPSCREWGSLRPHVDFPGSPSASALPEGTGRRQYRA